MRRRTRTREVPRRRRYLIYCAASCTEPEYFRALRALFPDVVIKVKCEPGKGKSPFEAVKTVQGIMKRTPHDFDEHWCVVDVDEFDLTDAAREALAGGIEIAVSNPCFELWLLLHHSPRTVALQDAKAAGKALGQHVDGYDKTRLDFRAFAGGIGDAVGRARLLHGTVTDRDPFPNPSSGVWRLIESLRDAQGS